MFRLDPPSMLKARPAETEQARLFAPWPRSCLTWVLVVRDKKAAGALTIIGRILMIYAGWSHLQHTVR